MKALHTLLAVVIMTCTLLAATSCTSVNVAPSGLLCNLLTQPEKCVITEPQPDFGWVVNSAIQGDRQTAFRILVASSPALLKSEQGDM